MLVSRTARHGDGQVASDRPLAPAGHAAVRARLQIFCFRPRNRPSGPSLLLRTTSNSYQPGAGCSRRFWFEPADQKATLGLEILIMRDRHSLTAAAAGDQRATTWTLRPPLKATAVGQEAATSLNRVDGVAVRVGPLGYYSLRGRRQSGRAGRCPTDRGVAVGLAPPELPRWRKQSRDLSFDVLSLAAPPAGRATRPRDR